MNDGPWRNKTGKKKMEKILISACLIGEKVKYNGGDNRIDHSLIEKWRSQGRLIPICPEVAGDLPVPRNPAEIQWGEGNDVLNNNATVVDKPGNNVSNAFKKGAHQALELAKKHGVRIAILKERSPSCGSNWIYDGSFAGVVKEGMGVTARLLQQNGIKTFGEQQVLEVENLMQINP